MACAFRRLARRMVVVCPLVVMLACGDGKTLCFCGDDDSEVPRDGGPQFAPAFDAGARTPARDVDVADAPEDSALADAASAD